MTAPEIAWGRLNPDQRAAIMAVVEAAATRAWCAGWDAAERQYLGEYPAPTDDEHRRIWRQVAQHHRVEVAA